MSIRTEWDNPEQTRLLFEFYEPYTWAEFHEAVQKIHAMTASVTQTVDMIVWTKVAPPEGAALTQVRAVFKTQPANTGRTIIVNEQSNMMILFTKRMAGIVQTLFPGKSKMVYANTLEEARKLSSAIKA